MGLQSVEVAPVIALPLFNVEEYMSFKYIAYINSYKGHTLYKTVLEEEL